MPSFCRAEELQGFNSESFLDTVFTLLVFLQPDSPCKWESGERELVWGTVCPLASACCTKRRRQSWQSFSACLFLWFPHPVAFSVSSAAPWEFTKCPQELWIILLRTADYPSDKLLERCASGRNGMRFVSLRLSVLWTGQHFAAGSDKVWSKLFCMCARHFLP